MSEQPAAKPRLDFNAVLMIVAGLLACGFGAYLLITRKGNSPTGAMIFSVGLTFFPVAILGIIGGLGLLGVAGWIIWLGPIGLDWARVAFCAIIGLLAITERSKQFRR